MPAINFSSDKVFEKSSSITHYSEICKNPTHVNADVEPLGVPPEPNPMPNSSPPAPSFPCETSSSQPTDAGTQAADSSRLAGTMHHIRNGNLGKHLGDVPGAASPSLPTAALRGDAQELTCCIQAEEEGSTSMDSSSAKGIQPRREWVQEAVRNKMNDHAERQASSIRDCATGTNSKSAHSQSTNESLTQQGNTHEAIQQCPKEARQRKALPCTPVSPAATNTPSRSEVFSNASKMNILRQQQIVRLLGLLREHGGACLRSGSQQKEFSERLGGQMTLVEYQAKKNIFHVDPYSAEMEMEIHKLKAAKEVARGGMEKDGTALPKTDYDSAGMDNSLLSHIPVRPKPISICTQPPIPAYPRPSIPQYGISPGPAIPTHAPPGYNHTDPTADKVYHRSSSSYYAPREGRDNDPYVSPSIHCSNNDAFAPPLSTTSFSPSSSPTAPLHCRRRPPPPPRAPTNTPVASPTATRSPTPTNDSPSRVDIINNNKPPLCTPSSDCANTLPPPLLPVNTSNITTATSSSSGSTQKRTPPSASADPSNARPSSPPSMIASSFPGASIVHLPASPVVEDTRGAINDDDDDEVDVGGFEDIDLDIDIDIDIDVGGDWVLVAGGCE